MKKCKFNDKMRFSGPYYLASVSSNLAAIGTSVEHLILREVSMVKLMP